MSETTITEKTLRCVLESPKSSAEIAEETGIYRRRIMRIDAPPW